MRTLLLSLFILLSALSFKVMAGGMHCAPVSQVTYVSDALPAVDKSTAIYTETVFISQQPTVRHTQNSESPFALWLGLFTLLLPATGIHRVMMGASWKLLPQYILTGGGFFFVLPVLDFIGMIRKPQHFQNNHTFLASIGKK